MLRIGRDEPALLASDVHLAPEAPATAEAFLAGLAAHGPGAAHLFLLGDLFELWVGDDGSDPLADRLADALAALSARGTRVWLMRGNRDFLLDVPVPGAAGPSYAARCGATLLDDPCPLVLHDVPALLSHGDALCTDDLVYQQWRRTCRDPGWQRGFLERPLAERFAIGRSVRETSEAGKREKPGALMDVNGAAVDAAMDAAGARLLVHGHTHRPATHAWPHPAGGRTRIVLPDWDAAQRRGGWLRWVDGTASPIAAFG
ncbi:MAG TPA: UDP-2,3-diacylglucosamine diphosphatase [Burkholderiaceae bacterium]|nr:UDP-2,3-diacylglucosamine diphosphatase [Burkholderiaceae bacterium]